jgi:DNA-binding transcriptional ArsR family regulator
MYAAQSSSDVFQAIADPNRRRLLGLLSAGEKPVQELAGHFDITFAAVSQHLSILRDAGLVVSRAQGRQRLYSLDARPLRIVNDWTLQYSDFWKSRLGRLRKYLDDKK